MRCPRCKATNSQDSSFCMQCGTRLPSTNRPKSSFGSSKYLAGGIIVLLLAGMVLLADQQYRTSQSQVPVSRARSSVFDGSTLQLASLFLCSCGSCQEPELRDCSCPTAIEEKQYIADELSAGRTVEETVQLVQERYGGRKID